MTRIYPFLIAALLAGCASPPATSSKAPAVIGAYEEPIVAKVPPTPGGTAPSGVRTWHPDDLKEWYVDYLKKEKGDQRGLMYQGSDARFHYFIARIPSTKSWESFIVAKSELKLDQEKKDLHAIAPPRGYGFVDPFRGYRLMPRIATP